MKENNHFDRRGRNPLQIMFINANFAKILKSRISPYIVIPVKAGNHAVLAAQECTAYR